MPDALCTADTLIAARKDGAIARLSEPPKSRAEGYAAQDAVIERIDSPVLGWKAAFTNAAAMERMKIDEPAIGPLFEAWTYRSGAAIPPPENCLRRVECEYAFRLARGLPARDEPYSREDVCGAVGSLHPAIEIVHSRVADAFELGVPVMIADHCVNFAFAYGTGVSDWRDLDLIDQPVTLFVAGELAAQGSGAEVQGDPLRSLVWLVNRLAGRGGDLGAGALLATGGCTGMHPAPCRCKLIAEFGALGRCEAACVARGRCDPVEYTRIQRSQ